MNSVGITTSCRLYANRYFLKLVVYENFSKLFACVEQY